MKKQLFLLSFFLLLTSCKTTSLVLREKYTNPQVLPVEDLCPEEIMWKNIEIEGLSSNSVQITGHIVKSTSSEWKCIKIDLDEQALRITAAPYKKHLGKRFFLKEFASKSKAIAAINTVPFDLDGRTYIPVSIVKIDGEVICAPTQFYSVLGFHTVDGKLRAVIYPNQNQEEIDSLDYAFGGFFTILQNDTIFEFEKYKRSRSAVGVSNSGRFLYLFAGCGINCPTGRNGFNFEECAIILQKLGCDSAMEFDGGHSTGLTLKNKNAIKPSLQRKVPAAFGFITNISE